MTARIFSDTIELGRTLIDLGDGYAGESVNAAPVLPGRFEVTFQLDGEGAAALDHLLAAAALKVRPSMPPVRSIAQVFARRHLVTAQKAGEAHKAAWAELAELRKLLAGRPRRWSSRGSCGGAAGRSGTPPARRRKPGGMPGAGAARGPTEPVRLAYRFTERRPACPPWRRSPAGLTLRTWA